MNMSIFTRMALFIITPIIGCLLLVSYMTHKYTRDLLMSEINKDAILAVENIKYKIIGKTSEINSLLSEISMTPSIIAFLETRKGMPDDVVEKRSEAISSSTSALFTELSILSLIGIVDINGVIVAHNKKEFIGRNMLAKPYVAQALSGIRSSMTVPGREYGATTSAIAMPVLSGSRVVGAVYCILDMNKLAALARDTLSLVETDLTFVYDSSGTLLLSQGKTMRQPLAEDARTGTSGVARGHVAAAPAADKETSRTSLRGPVAGDAASGSGVADDQYPTITGRFIAETAGGSRTYDWNGVSWLALFEKIPLMDWTLVVRVKTDDIFAPVNFMTRQNLLATTGLTVLILVVVSITARRFSRLLTVMGRIAHKMATGTFALNAEEQAYLEYYCGRFGEIGEFCQSVRSMLSELHGHICAQKRETSRIHELAKKAARAAERAHAAGQAKRMDMLAAAQQLTSTLGIIASASSDLSAKIEESERGAAAQAASAAETASCMEQMHSTVYQVAHNTERAFEVSNNARKKAEQGSDVA